MIVDSSFPESNAVAPFKPEQPRPQRAMIPQIRNDRSPNTPINHHQVLPATPISIGSPEVDQLFSHSPATPSTSAASTPSPAARLVHRPVVPEQPKRKKPRCTRCREFIQGHGPICPDGVRKSAKNKIPYPQPTGLFSDGRLITAEANRLINDQVVHPNFKLMLKNVKEGPGGNRDWTTFTESFDC